MYDFGVDMWWVSAHFKLARETELLEMAHAKQTDRHRQTNNQTNRHADRQTNRYTDRQTNRHTDRHTDRQMNRHTDTQTKSVRACASLVKALFLPLSCARSTFAGMLAAFLESCSTTRRYFRYEHALSSFSHSLLFCFKHLIGKFGCFLSCRHIVANGRGRTTLISCHV